MLHFIGELLVEAVVAPLMGGVMAVLWWLLRTSWLLAAYPFLVLTGWLRLWRRERGRVGLPALWRAHGVRGLHRFGWQEAALDVHYLLATLLIALAAGSVGLVLRGILEHLG